LISEVQVAGVDAGDEFIEIYNPTSAAIDISGWSIQYLGGTSQVENVVKKNFEAGNVLPSRGFFLIARGKNTSGVDGYSGSVSVDLVHRSFSLSGASSGGKLFLVNDAAKIDSLSDVNIVDALDYSFLVPEAGQSLERRAWQGGCVSAQGPGETLGNGCDTDNNAADFEILSTAKPDNSLSSSEPN